MFDTSLYGSLGPIPGCFSSWVFGSRPWLFSSRPSVPCSSAHLLADCFSDTVLRSQSEIGFMFRARGTRCRLLLLHFSFEAILGFDSRASPALAGFFSPDCDFYARHRPRFITFALLRARPLVWSAPPALLCSTLLRRSRWTWGSAVVYHNLVC